MKIGQKKIDCSKCYIAWLLSRRQALAPFFVIFLNIFFPINSQSTCPICLQKTYFHLFTSPQNDKMSNIFKYTVMFDMRIRSSLWQEKSFHLQIVLGESFVACQMCNVAILTFLRSRAVKIYLLPNTTTVKDTCVFLKPFHRGLAQMCSVLKTIKVWQLTHELQPATDLDRDDLNGENKKQRLTVSYIDVWRNYDWTIKIMACFPQIIFVC